MSFLQLVACFSLLSVTVFSESPLLQVNVVYRHGDRAPIHPFPLDRYNISEWPMGYGGLTEVGVQQHLGLGLFLRGRYNSSIKTSYDYREIRIQSSDIDRCLLSAYANLAGLYSRGGPSWDAPYLSWQPVPVHSVPNIQDELLAMDRPCNVADREAERLLTSSSTVRQLILDYESFFKLISAKTGTSLTKDTLSTAGEIYDTLFCESAHNLTTPAWLGWTNITCSDSRIVPCANRSVFEILKAMNDLKFTVRDSTHIMHRFRGGPLAVQMMKNIDACITNGSSVPKFYVYSAHDTTVAAFLSALGAFHGVQPAYAATAMLELRGESGQPGTYEVRLLYKNATDESSVYHLDMAECPSPCTVDGFRRMMLKLRISDWDEECENEKLTLFLGLTNAESDPFSVLTSTFSTI